MDPDKERGVYKEKVEDLIGSVRFNTFTKWEQGFLESVKEQLGEKRRLTDQQVLKLYEIHDRYFG